MTSYDAAIKIQSTSTKVTYPLDTNVAITVAPTHGHTPTGTVQLFDGTTLLQKSRLQGNGAAYLYVQGLAAGVQFTECSVGAMHSTPTARLLL